MKDIIFTEGIIIRSIPYKDKDRIVTIFSKEKGVLSFLAKKIMNKKKSGFSLLTPFCLGEFHLRPTKGDLFQFYDGSVIDHFLHLRHEYSYIHYAAKMAKALQTYLLPQKKSLLLYLLFHSYLKNIAKNPSVIYISFLLKFLHHEGLLHLHAYCNVCQKESVEYMQKGECLCSKHKTDISIPISSVEITTLQGLLLAKSFSHFIQISYTKNLEEKIEIIFQQALNA